MTCSFRSKAAEDDEADLAVYSPYRDSLQHEEWAKKQNDGPTPFNFLPEVRNYITESFIVLIRHVLRPFFLKL